MGIRLPTKFLTRYNVLTVAQLVVNVSLAVWLYNEYLHNPFMQEYMSAVWATIWPEVAISVGIGVGIVVSLIVYRRGHFRLYEAETVSRPTSLVSASDNLATIDVCPFCNTALKTISAGRLQCRNCRRYFKSSLPKVIT